MNRDFMGSQPPEDSRHIDQRWYPFVDAVSPPPWMQAHLAECLSCLNDFTRLQSLGAPRSPGKDGGLQFAWGLGAFVELGAFMLEHKKMWLLPIALILVLFGGLIVVTQGSAVAPFVFTVW